MVSDALNSFGIKEAFAKKRNLYDFYFHKYQHETMKITMEIKRKSLFHYVIQKKMHHFIILLCLTFSLSQ